MGSDDEKLLVVAVVEASSAGTIETIEVAAFTVPQSILFRADDVIER
jgi:hypothetical protein